MTRRGYDVQTGDLQACIFPLLARNNLEMSVNHGKQTWIDILTGCIFNEATSQLRLSG